MLEKPLRLLSPSINPATTLFFTKPCSRVPHRHLSNNLYLLVTWQDKHCLAKHLSFLLFPPAFIAEYDTNGTDYPFAQWGSAVLAVFPPSFLSIPSLLWELRSSWICVNPAQQWLKYPCVIGSLSKNPKHSPMLTTVKKINCFPAKTADLIMCT